MRRLVDYYCITEICDDLIGKFKADIPVGELAAAVKDGDLYLVARFEKAGNLTHFYPEIMWADLEPKTHLLHFEGFCVLLVLLLLFRLLVIELAPIDDFYHWWLGVG